MKFRISALLYHVFHAILLPGCAHPKIIKQISYLHRVLESMALHWCKYPVMSLWTLILLVLLSWEIRKKDTDK